MPEQQEIRFGKLKLRIQFPFLKRTLNPTAAVHVACILLADLGN